MWEMERHRGLKRCATLTGCDPSELMIIGIPHETKADEHRVSLTPDKVDLLVRSGHEILVEDNAGAGANFPNAEYEGAGASLCTLGGELFDRSEMIVKVKEPQPQEYELFTRVRSYSRSCTWLRLLS